MSIFKCLVIFIVAALTSFYINRLRNRQTSNIFWNDLRNAELKDHYYIERVFKHKGYFCVVVLHEFGHRCGYVGIPKSHSLYGMNYDDLDNVSVHGGLSYSDNSQKAYPLYMQDDIWWFGFDCAHCFDGRDYKAAREHFPLSQERINNLESCDLKYPNKDELIRTTQYVMKQCKSLAKQLKEME